MCACLGEKLLDVTHGECQQGARGGSGLGGGAALGSRSIDGMMTAASAAGAGSKGVFGRALVSTAVAGVQDLLYAAELEEVAKDVDRERDA